MGVVEQPIADGVGDGSLSELIVPVLDLELAGEDGGAGAVAVVEDLEQIAVGSYRHFPPTWRPRLSLRRLQVSGLAKFGPLPGRRWTGPAGLCGYTPERPRISRGARSH